jgi:uncharacterized membrane-anchored protein
LSHELNNEMHAHPLLRSRVDVKRETQNQLLLVAMNHHAELQLHFQQTVEGLPVAAITYYVVGLIAYVVHASEDVSPWHLNSELIKAVAIPVMTELVFFGIRRIKHTIHHTKKMRFQSCLKEGALDFV